tara:strand:- start:294 stop:530 length:237 start_codon:yes stop_codon:yes gene_type:complete
MENETKPLIERKKMNTLQLMALAAMLLTFFSGDKTLFATATAMMCGLKIVSMVIYEDSKEAFFATIYAGFAILFFLDK